MAKSIKEVLGIVIKSKGQNTWKCITTRGQDGREKNENIIIINDPDKQKRISDVFDSPGRYEIEYEKSGDYWSICNASKINGQSKAEIEKTEESKQTSQNCNPLHAVAMVLSATITSGIFKPETLDEAMLTLANMTKTMIKTLKEKQ